MLTTTRCAAGALHISDDALWTMPGSDREDDRGRRPEPGRLAPACALMRTPHARSISDQTARDSPFCARLSTWPVNCSAIRSALNVLRNRARPPRATCSR